MRLSAADIAGVLSVTTRAINKRAKKENWPYEYENGRGGRKKMYAADKLPRDIRLLIYKESGQKEIPPGPPFSKWGGSEAGPSSKGGGGEAGPLGYGHGQGVPSAARGTAGELGGGEINSQQMVLAAAKSDLLALYLKRIKSARHGKKQKAREDFATAYNSGAAWPELYEKIGPVSWKTLEAWKKMVDQAGGDITVLADHRGYVKRGNTELSPEAKQLLIRCALSPNRPHISEAIRTARAVMAAKGIKNGLSDATYRRFLRDWRDANYHIWVFNRQGAKAWNDKCAFDIARDYSLINVGDILVADGHVLNFEIVNPWTGKPKRMTLLVWFDMKSSRIKRPFAGRVPENGFFG